MKFKITCSENYQTVEFDVTVDSKDAIVPCITDAIRTVRSAIKAATEDVGTSKKKEPMTAGKTVVTGNEVIRPSESQIAYLKKLGISDEEIENIDSFNQASEIITRITGKGLRMKK